MSLMELADDLWARFCRMNDHMQVIWLEKYAERPVHIVLMQDINKYLDEKYNRDYVAFYKRINNCDWWDVDKKWFIDYLDCNAMSSDDTLTAEAWTNTNLLSIMGPMSRPLKKILSVFLYKWIHSPLPGLSVSPHTPTCRGMRQYPALAMR